MSSGHAESTPIAQGPSSSVVQGLAQTPVAAKPSGGFRSVAYFTNWGIYGRNYPPSKIPAEKLTHVLYAFADNKPDGTVFLTDTWSDLEKHYEGDSWNDVGTNMYGNLKQLNLLKRRNRNLKILLSIGGWTYTNTNKHLDEPAGNREGRLRFAKSCVQLIKDMGFDGIDIDWEYPQNPGQGEQLLLLLQAIREEMDAYARSLVTRHGYPRAPHFELSIAAPAGKTNYQNLPLDRLAGVLDFINLMAYDYSGAWETATSHQANLYASQSNPRSTPFNTHGVINDYLAAGVPSEKIVLGMPLYGRAFPHTEGMGKPFGGVGDGDWEKGIWDYKNLPKPGSQLLYDSEAEAHYSWDPANGGTVITYDTPFIAQRKADYIVQRKLGGAMWWELSGDRPVTDANSLILNTLNRLTTAPNNGKISFSENWVWYPDSKFDNLRTGFPKDNVPIVEI
ncbi:uncharacterized protein EI97DRAFT_249274 [Westerdykella ornata]|uniref:chitinase n=1 Tax=Westerdykella ornata TaxID=318751 RepID=A0A6A6JP23_WESOR|nr:uncharacterized protein EI97DRAFT_249274 [Westerdykella ornata]KAF2278272.1 hypothetical protein EI97DRAFT_249274 [Westerdykella ornata]